jgi:hypothetical protein
MGEGLISRNDALNNSSDHERMIDTGLSSGTAKFEPEPTTPTSIYTIDRSSYPSPLEDGEGEYVAETEERGPSGTNCSSRKNGVVRFHKRLVGGDDLSIATSTDSSNMLDTGTHSLTEDQLKFKLKEVECELSAEKAMRRKKDASLVKLAKQLQKCTKESDTKDQQILKMAKNINELEELLHKHRCEAAEDQQKIRNVCREMEERVEEYEALVQSLKKQIAEANLEVEMLVARMEMEHEIASARSTACDESIADRYRDVEIEHEIDVQSKSWVTKGSLLAIALSGAAVAVGAGLSRGAGRTR